MRRARKVRPLPANVVPIRPSIDLGSPLRPRFGLTSGGVWVAQQWEQLEPPQRAFVENLISEMIRQQT